MARIVKFKGVDAESFIYLLIYLITFSFLLLFLYSCSQSNSESRSGLGYKEQISIYQKKLQSEPGNCFYLSQIAAGYQALNEFDNAINYYQKALDNCPEDLFNKFQLGISHYVIMEKDIGIAYMDEAIEGAEKKGDVELLEMFKSEKEAWLEKWDSIKELDWNKK